MLKRYGPCVEPMCCTERVCVKLRGTQKIVFLVDCLTFCSIDDYQCLRSCYFEHDEKIGSS